MCYTKSQNSLCQEVVAKDNRIFWGKESNNKVLEIKSSGRK